MSAQSMESAGLAVPFDSECDPRLRASLQQLMGTTLVAQATGENSSPSFAGMTVSGLSSNLTVGTGTGGLLETFQNLRPAASPTFAALTLSGLSGDVGDNVVVGTGGLLAAQPASAGVVKSVKVWTPAAVPAGTAALDFATTEHDNTGGWWVIGQPSRVTVDEDGLYLLSFALAYVVGVADPLVTALFHKNGIPINTGPDPVQGPRVRFTSLTDIYFNLNCVGPLLAGDYIQAVVSRVSGGSAAHPDVCFLSVTKLGVLS